MIPGARRLATAFDFQEAETYTETVVSNRLALAWSITDLIS
jgi:hypothetical protein